MNKPQEQIIFLDLEDTIISNWYDGRLLGNNIKRIRNTINDRFPNFKFLNIWSFAIYNQKDIEEFDIRLRNEVEVAMRHQIDFVICVDRMMELVKEYENIQYDLRQEFMQLNGKFYSFIKYCQLYTDLHLILFDDLVPNMIMHIPDKNLTIETIRI